MDSFENAVLRIIERYQAARFNKHNGLVTSWDAKKHLAKVQLQPNGQETGWIPVHTMSAGGGFGHMSGLIVGEQVEVTHQEGELEAGAITTRVHSDVDVPPQLESGEELIKTTFGSSVFLAKDGSVTITDKGGSIIKMDGSGGIKITNSGTFEIDAQTINLVGNVHLGSTGGVPTSQQGTVDTGGNSDISSLATKVWTT